MISVKTTHGEARVYVAAARGKPKATLVLGHGAGGAPDFVAADLDALAHALPERGITVMRVEQPWKVAGRKVAAPPPQLDAAWIDVLNHLDITSRLVVGGRSAGARVACRTATAVAAAGCLALAFPLHPPGKPRSTRVEELTGAGVPTLVIQGERDTFGSPTEFPPDTNLTVIPYAGHSFAVPKAAEVTQSEALQLLVDAAATWITGLVSR